MIILMKYIISSHTAELCPLTFIMALLSVPLMLFESNAIAALVSTKLLMDVEVMFIPKLLLTKKLATF